MPDGEVAVVGLCVHQVAAVVGEAGPGNALARLGGIDERIGLLPQTSGLGIEGHAAEAVLLAVVTLGIGLAG